VLISYDELACRTVTGGLGLCIVLGSPRKVVGGLNNQVKSSEGDIVGE